MNFFKYILSFNTYIVEYILKFRAWLGFIFSVIFGIDLDFKFNEDENTEFNKIDKTKEILRSKSDNNSNNVSITPSLTIPASNNIESIPNIENNNIKNNYNINLEREKQILSDRFNNITNVALGLIFSATGSIVFSSTSWKTKITATSIAILAAFGTSELLFNLKNRALNNIKDLILYPSYGHGQWNLIDTNELINKILSLMDQYHNLDIDSRMMVLSILLLLIVVYFTVYIFFFIVSPLIFDAIKDILPIKIKNFMVRFININRKISVPFVILGFICIIIPVLVIILALAVIVYFNNIN